MFSSDELTLFVLFDHGTPGCSQIWAVPRSSTAPYRVTNFPVGPMELCPVPWGDGDEHLVNVVAFSAMVVTGPDHEEAAERDGVLAATAEADEVERKRAARGIVAVDDLPARQWDSWDPARRRAHPFLVALARPAADGDGDAAAAASHHRWRSGRYHDLLAGVDSDCPDQPWHGLSDAVGFAPGAEAAAVSFRPPEWRSRSAWSTATALYQCRNIPVLDVVASARDAADTQAAASAAPTHYRLGRHDADAAPALTSEIADAASEPGSPDPRTLQRQGSRLRIAASSVDAAPCTEGLPGPDGAPAPALALAGPPRTSLRCLTGDRAAPAWCPAFSPDGGTLVWLGMTEPGYESDRTRVFATTTDLAGAVKTADAPEGTTISVRSRRADGAAAAASSGAGPAPSAVDSVPALSSAPQTWCLTDGVDASFGSLEWADECTLVASTTARGTARVAVLRVGHTYAGGESGSATPGIRKVVSGIESTCALLAHGSGSLSAPVCAGSTTAAGSDDATLRVLGLASAMHRPQEVLSLSARASDVDAAALAEWSPRLSEGTTAADDGLPLAAAAERPRLLTGLARGRLASFAAPMAPAAFQVYPTAAPLPDPALPAGRDPCPGASRAAPGPGAAGEPRHQWVLLPPGLDEASAPAATVPVVVLVHGGPQGSWNDDFHRRWNAQVWASQGFACVMPNFTGSTGFGQDLVDAISGDWGGQPAADVVAGLAAAAKAHPSIDLGRAVLCGASYGGFMVHWLQSHAPAGTFRCSVSHAGLFDMRSFYYATDELWFPEHDFGGTYDEVPAAYERFNPARFAALWRTPMLVIAGGRDFRVPQEQALGAFTALRRKGVPARLLVLPEASHWVSDAAQFCRWHREMLVWAGEWSSTSGPAFAE